MTPMLGIMASAGKHNTPVLPITANLTGQWDASNASSVTLSSGKVSQLNDLSGNSRHMVQATGANQPTYTTSAKNGLNVMTFSGGQYLVPASTWTQTTMTQFLVFQSNASSGNQMNTGWSAYQGDFSCNGSSNTPASTYHAQFEPGGPTAAVNFTRGTVDNLYHYFSMARPNTGTPTMTLDGNTTAWTRISGETGTLTNLSTGKLWIGTRNDLATPMTGSICEVLLYSTVMNGTDIATVNAYLASKWAI